MTDGRVRNTDSTETVFDSAVVSRREIHRCVGEIESAIGSGSRRHRLKFRTTITDVDILLFAYLALYRASHPETTFEIWLPFSNQKGGIFSRIENYRAQATFTVRTEIFGIRFWDGVDDETSEPEKDLFSSVKLRDIAGSFAPVLLVAPETIEALFFKPYDPGPVGSFVLPELGGDNETVRRSFSKAWIETLERKVPPESGLAPARSLPAFWRSLESAKVLAHYLAKDNEEIYGTMAYGNFSRETFERHFSNLSPIFESVEKRPPIFHFVFYLLLGSELIPGGLSTANFDVFRDNIKNLVDLTARLVAGLAELARNITQHSTEQCGVITLRRYDRPAARELFGLDTELSAEQRTAFGRATSVLDINVVDLGTRGVVPTLAASVADGASNEPNEKLRASYIADRVRIEGGTFRLEHLLDPKNGVRLDHQAKRAIAHLGLQIFSRIVEENRGVIKASSLDARNTRDDFPRKSFPGTLPSHGTSFNILLPVEPDREYGGRLPGDLFLGREPTRAEMMSLEDFFMIRSVPLLPKSSTPQLRETNTEELSKNACVTYALRPRVMSDRTTEKVLWLDIFAQHQEQLLSARFRSLDFDKISGLSASMLFRLVGRWQLEFPGRSLIIFNVANEVFLDLVEVNDRYTEILNFGLPSYEERVDYWSADAVQLVYSHVQINDNMRFHLADALWGADKAQFFSINRTIRNTNFNSITLTTEVAEEVDPESVPDVVVDRLSGSDLFYRGQALLPFDLILRAASGSTLFEQNAKALLMNELNIA